jgi:hypothetical protein
MIGYCAADPNYFNLYFDLWATQMNRYYPEMRKIISVYNPAAEIETQCKQHNIELRSVELPENPQRPHYYLLRWLNLPFDTNELILETQINCLPIRTQKFNQDQLAEHLRISRWKRGKPGGVSAAVFTPQAAKKIAAQAKTMLQNPIDGDHQMNQWQAKNLVTEHTVTEQQFKSLNKTIEPYTHWITAGTSQNYTPAQKLQILQHYTQQ